MQPHWVYILCFTLTSCIEYNLAIISLFYIVQENVYYVLENNGSLHVDKAVSPDPNTLELPPPISAISSWSETATCTHSAAPSMTSNADSEDMASGCHHETVSHHEACM